MGDLTTFTFPGRATTRGCQHMAVWLPLFSELCRLEGIVKSHLDVTQVAGDYEKSGGTHREGTAADVEQYAERINIGPCVDVSISQVGLLRAHVLRRAHELPLACVKGLLR